MKFSEGDFVRILTREEYNLRGGSCTKDSAISCYGGSVCLIEKPVIPGYKLIPYDVVTNFNPKTAEHVIFPIEHYAWGEQSLESCAPPDEEKLSQGFLEVF